MSESGVEDILALCRGVWSAGALALAARVGLFTRLSEGCDTNDALVEQTGLPRREIDALLGALAGLGLVTGDGERWRNSESAALFLVEGLPTSLCEMAQSALAPAASWSARIDARAPALEAASCAGAWPLSVATANLAFAYLGLADAGPVTMLDLGGGSGAFSAVLLGLNVEARAVQIDRVAANVEARERLASMGLGARFEARDEDIFEATLDAAAFDVVVCSRVAHAYASSAASRLFSRARRALRPGGCLVLADEMRGVAGGGHPMAELFGLHVALHTEGGEAWSATWYREALTDVGFGEVELLETPTPYTLVLARS